jgi:hypothetical protein
VAGVVAFVAEGGQFYSKIEVQTLWIFILGL